MQIGDLEKRSVDKGNKINKSFRNMPFANRVIKKERHSRMHYIGWHDASNIHQSRMSSQKKKSFFSFVAAASLCA